MARWLKVDIVLAEEDLISVPSTHAGFAAPRSGSSSHLVTEAPGDLMSSHGQGRHMHTPPTYT